MSYPRTSNGTATFLAGEAIAADVLVKMSAATVVAAGLGDEPIGITEQAVASGKQVSIRLLQGNVEVVTAAKAISAGAALYTAAAGRVSDAAVGKCIGYALEEATAAAGKISAIVWGCRGASDILASRADVIEFWDDFFKYDTTNDWTVVEDAGAGTGDVITDARGGVVNIGCDGDDNDECYVSSKNEIFLFTTTKKCYFEARVKLTEANTDDANIIIGLSDTVGADSLLDNGGGPMASYSGAVFFKVDGGTVWQFETSNAGTQNTNTNVGAFTSATWTKLGFLYDYNDGTTAIVTPYIDGVAGTAKNLTISGSAEMHILMGVKAGGANEENLLVDYINVIAER